MLTHSSEWLTVDEAARELRLSRSSVYRMIRDGSLEAYRVGQAGSFRFQPEAVRRVLTPARHNHEENA